MMTNKSKAILPTALVLILGSPLLAKSEPSVIELAHNFSADPITANGTSGGAKQSNCGSITETPSQIVKVTSEQINFMRLRVEGEGNPTLLVEGPGGRFCVLTVAGQQPEISGVWLKGTYKIFVGDRSGGRHPYKLYITQKNSQA